MSAGEIGVKILMGLFAVGVAGCLITIPICAYKFFSVLLEKNDAEERSDAGQQF